MNKACLNNVPTNNGNELYIQEEVLIQAHSHGEALGGSAPQSSVIPKFCFVLKKHTTKILSP